MEKFLAVLMVIGISGCVIDNDHRSLVRANNVLSNCEEIRQHDNRFMVMVTPGNNSSTDVYIPKDITECFTELDKMLSTESRLYIAGQIENLSAEDTEKFRFFFSNGLRMILKNIWGLRNGSRLSNFFYDFDILNHEDMYKIILVSYQRYLKNEPVELSEQIKSNRRMMKMINEPPPYINPETGKEEKIRLDRTNINNNRIIHFGTNMVTGEALSYEYDKGWYKSDE